MFTYIKNEYNRNPGWVLEGTEKDEGMLVYDIEYDISPYLIIPETVNDFYKMHKPKFWYNINRSEKLFEKEIGPLSFNVISDKDLLLRYLPQIQQLFAARWKDSFILFDWKTKKGFLKYQDAMLNLAANGCGEIAILTYNDTLLSFAYSLIYNKRYYFFEHAVIREEQYKKYSLGKILIKKLMESVIERKFEIFDFMTGDTPYKKEWAKEEKKVYLRIAEAKTPYGLVKFSCKVFLCQARKMWHKWRHKDKALLLINKLHSKVVII